MSNTVVMLLVKASGAKPVPNPSGGAPKVIPSDRFVEVAYSQTLMRWIAQGVLVRQVRDQGGVPPAASPAARGVAPIAIAARTRQVPPSATIPPPAPPPQAMSPSLPVGPFVPAAASPAAPVVQPPSPAPVSQAELERRALRERVRRDREATPGQT